MLRLTLFSSLRRWGAVCATTALAFGTSLAPAPAALSAVPHPLVTDYQVVSTALMPPTQAACNAIGRRCWAPPQFQTAYNLTPLYTAGNQGQGVTVAVVDSFGSQTLAADLANFNTQFGLQHMCGEANHTCAPGDPTFSILCVQACTDAKSTANGHQQDRSAWSVEVSLDVEWVHAVAPKANVMLVTVPTAETLGVPGLPQMMNAEQYVIDHHLAQVISQSFGASEETFNGVTREPSRRVQVGEAEQRQRLRLLRRLRQLQRVQDPGRRAQRPAATSVSQRWVAGFRPTRDLGRRHLPVRQREHGFTRG
jgi:hypothetical protein